MRVWTDLLSLRSSRATSFVALALVAGFAGCASTPSSEPAESDPAGIDLPLFERLLAERPIEPLTEEDLAEVTDPWERPPQGIDLDPAGEGGSAGADAADPESEVSPLDTEGQDPLEDDLASLIQAADENDPPPINPYLEFGSQIYVYEETGFVMKPYTFPPGIGQKALSMLQTYGDFPIHGAAIDGQGMPDGSLPQPIDSVVLDLRNNWASESWADPRGRGLPAPSTVNLGDLLIVTARPEVLYDVEHFLKIFIEQVKQIEIEAKIVEVATTDRFDYGLRTIDSTTPIFALPNAGGLVRSVDYSFGNTVSGTEALFNVGAVFDGVQFNALLELVATEENVSIIDQPKAVTREGGRAEIINTEAIPFFNVSNINANGNFTTAVAYKDVGVQMYVIPSVVGEDTVILNIDIEASAQSGTAVAFTQQNSSSNSAVVTVPQISRRQAKTVVRLEPGQAVVIGGLISTRTLERESKVPFLGDIPFLGNLFKSKYQETEKTNVLFYIRPRVLQGGDLNAVFGD